MTGLADTVTARLSTPLAAWLPRQRWFAGKGRSLAAAEVAHSTVFTGQVPEGGPDDSGGGGSGRTGAMLVVRVTYQDTGGSEHYHVPVGLRADLEPPHARHVIAALDDRVVYDALGDDALVRALVGLATGEPPAPPAGREAASRPLSVEQSNTSVLVDDQYLVKFFRRLHPGVNPELEVQRALSRAGAAVTVPLHGAVEGTWLDAPLTYAVVHSYLADATDGWAMALDGLSRPDGLPAAPSSPPFAAHAHDLGTVVARMHRGLAETLGAAWLDAAGLRDLADTMHEQLGPALAAVPALAPYADRIRAVYRAVAELPGPVPAQRVHGDLHLGQVLHTPDGWTVIDFEGEPALPIRERVRQHSPLRDVAGMLRSFDYAAQYAPAGEHPQVRSRAEERARLRWSSRCAEAFCRGYRREARADPREQAVLLRAYTLHKAVYEAVYEAGNRPELLAVPLGAIGRLLGG
ncbi:maltokinase N-terminal cap-like domain-containing protein [Streptomyces sp. CA-111067]|uniref:maltokinase N-terminal cap-like domain-containing protein n=1 Tax=Streptomyces sp. CA-111067 TaxID=3240046 RepID=UPI003D970E94